MWSELGASWPDAGLVVISTAGIYLAFVVLIRVVGQRSLAAVAGFDLALVVAVGSVLARTSLVRQPSLAEGVIAIATMFGLQGLLGMLRKHSRLDMLINGRPILLVADHTVVHANLARAHVLESELHQKLRLAGVGSLADAQCVVLERNGAISVIRTGTRVDEDMISDVAGHERVRRGHRRDAAVKQAHGQPPERA